MKKHLAALLWTCLGLGASSAVVAVPVTFDFFGSCTDCSEIAGYKVDINATLVLDEHYDKNKKNASKNFVSFTYSGSNLVGGWFDGEEWEPGSPIIFGQGDFLKPTKLVLNNLVVEDGIIQSMTLRAKKIEGPLWGCTEAGLNVAALDRACSSNDSVVFKISNGIWSFGSPAADVGTAQPAAALQVPEPSTAALLTALLFAPLMLRKAAKRRSNC